jgi:galactokinase
MAPRQSKWPLLPGRIEFIGNHTDYNGGLVMGAAVAEGITLAVRRREDEGLHFVSDGMDAAEADLGNITPLSGSAAWANYPLGVIKALRDPGWKCLSVVNRGYQYPAEWRGDE